MIEEITLGAGAECTSIQQVVTVHYKGTFPDGKTFDSSYERGEPATFRLSQLIEGWQKGIPGMKVGGKRRLTVPYDLGYGAHDVKDDDGNVVIPGKSTLVFEIELLGVR